MRKLLAAKKYQLINRLAANRKSVGFQYGSLGLTNVVFLPPRVSETTEERSEMRSRSDYLIGAST